MFQDGSIVRTFGLFIANIVLSFVQGVDQLISLEVN